MRRCTVIYNKRIRRNENNFCEVGRMKYLGGVLGALLKNKKVNTNVTTAMISCVSSRFDTPFTSLSSSSSVTVQ